MNALKMLTANAPATGNQSLYNIINGLGLTTNLKLCLDAGDSASYNASVQTAKWLDTSGNGYDFFRGTSTAGDGAEPTFNGTTGGLSSNEYWSFDGGDCFLYDTTPETWMNNLHKDGAIFSVISIIYKGLSAVNYRTLTTSSTTGGTTQRGVRLLHSASTGTAGAPQVAVRGDSANALSIQGSVTTPENSWSVVGFSINENGGSNNFILKVNGNTEETFTVSYATPSSNDVIAAAIGSFADGITQMLPSSTKFGCLAVWEGTALTATNLTDIYNGIKGRFGL